jgi:geranylgeranyl diphosphate synthase type II
MRASGFRHNLKRRKPELTEFKEKFLAYAKRINEALGSYVLKGKGLPQAEIFDAMGYSLLDGGKRIRPMLLLEFYRVCGGTDERLAMRFACSVEMIHTYSLIHDDLPCMDNDDMRRGRPTNHKVYGEAMAILAGDGLLTMAFENAIGALCESKDNWLNAALACNELASAAGAFGMVGGQTIDIKGPREHTVETLTQLHKKKTGALIKASVLMGCRLAGANEEQLRAAGRYAESVGLSFQIIDDILDAVGDPELLGKTAGKDQKLGKATFVSLLGLENSKKMAEELTSEALECLNAFSDTDYLKKLTTYLCTREK